ncbi:MAG TPA: hypothetical protein VKS21_08920 [Spirochaetota bacterium]|nr:hypothetical protein [Spirochaetota bacterium]
MKPQTLRLIDEPVRKAVLQLNQKNIITNSSEGGGDATHGAPDFAYVEAKISPENITICAVHNFLLDRIYSKLGYDDLLFAASALNYGCQTGYYVIGFKRSNMSNREVEHKFSRITAMLKVQQPLRAAYTGDYIF